MKRWLLIGLAAYVVVALLVLFIFITGKLTARQLGIGYIILFAIGVIVLTVMLQRSTGHSSMDVAFDATPNTKQREPIRKSTRNYIIAILVMCALLIYGLWDSNGYPLWVTLVGASLNIGIICVLLIAVRNKLRSVNHGGVSRPK